jgi:hypothetical protein
MEKGLNKKTSCFTTCWLYLLVILKYSCFRSRTMLDSCHSSKLGIIIKAPFPYLVPVQSQL